MKEKNTSSDRLLLLELNPHKSHIFYNLDDNIGHKANTLFKGALSQVFPKYKALISFRAHSRRYASACAWQGEDYFST